MQTIGQLVAKYGSHFVPHYDIHFSGDQEDGSYAPRQVLFIERLGHSNPLKDLEDVVRAVNYPAKSMQRSFIKHHANLPWWKRLFRTKYGLFNIVYQDLLDNFEIKTDVRRLDYTKEVNVLDEVVDVGTTVYFASAEGYIYPEGISEFQVDSIRRELSNDALVQYATVRLESGSMNIVHNGLRWNAGVVGVEAFMSREEAVAYLKSHYDAIVAGVETKKKDLK
jgi:hypothetical protein